MIFRGTLGVWGLGKLSCTKMLDRILPGRGLRAEEGGQGGEGRRKREKTGRRRDREGERMNKERDGVKRDMQTWIQIGKGRQRGRGRI